MINRSMRVLVLTHEYPPVGGGGGMAAQDICEGLVRTGYEMRVLTAHWGRLSLDEEINGVRVHRLRSGRTQPYKASLRSMLGYVIASFWRGLGIIRRWKPDVFHVHFAVPAGASAWALSRVTGIPYVLTAHLGDVPGGVPEKTEGWFRWVYPFTPPIWRTASRVVAVSEYTRQLALARYPVPIQVIPNGIHLKEIDPGTIHVGNPPQIAFAARFVAQKNPLKVVRTLAKLQDLPWTCALVGDGSLRAEVENEISLHNLQTRFILPGWVTPNEVLEWFRHSDILFMPSLSEGLPVAGIQALAMGLALVLSQVGGNPELVNPGENGFLVDKDDQAGFEQSLRILLSQPEVLLSCRLASRKLAERFDIDHVVESYRQIFEQSARGSSR